MTTVRKPENDIKNNANETYWVKTLQICQNNEEKQGYNLEEKENLGEWLEHTELLFLQKYLHYEKDIWDNKKMREVLGDSELEKVKL